MRLFAVITWLALWPVATAYSQPTSRFELWPVARLDRVFLEGGASGGTGVDASFAVTDRFNVAPELRFVYGGPARVGNNYRGPGVGARGVWRF
jgi:hypothetical protein